MPHIAEGGQKTFVIFASWKSDIEQLMDDHSRLQRALINNRIYDWQTKRQIERQYQIQTMVFDFGGEKSIACQNEHCLIRRIIE